MIHLLIIITNLLFCNESIIDSALVSNQDQDRKNFFTSSYKLERWLASSGDSEGLSVRWLDRYIDSRNINLMSYDDIMSLPNITPLDANAVMKQKKREKIEGYFQLKNSPGISNYGYKSLISFIDFNSTKTNELHLR